MADIFLSYASEDVERARLLAAALESRRWSVWWDRQIPHGHDYTVFIQQQLDAARCIVVLWSKASVSSGFVRDEANEGLNGRLVPLFLEAVKPPLGFRQLQTANLSNWSGGASHDEFKRLVDSIAAIVPPSVPPIPANSPLAGRPVDAGAPSHESSQNEPFRSDVFVSYAHLDNLALIEGKPGWVTNLRRCLEIRLGQRLGRQPHVLMNPKLDGQDFSPETHLAALQECAAFVSVVSPRYLRSEWALRELNEFVSAADRRGGVNVRGRSRVFKVLKTHVPLENLPAPLRPTLGYEFFRVDPETGKVREFDEVFGSDAQRDFWIRLDDLAHDIVDLLDRLRAGPDSLTV